MEHSLDMSQEELQKALEEAQRKAQEFMEKMTPEERAQAEIKARELIEADRASMQKLIEDAQRLTAPAPEAKAAPKFCSNCGAPVSGGKFCTNCGSAL